MKAFFLLSLIFCFNSYSAIYGTDDRVLVEEDQEHYPVFAQLAKGRYEETENGLILRPKLLKDHIPKLCPDERFANQPSLSKCTSFLVGPNLMVTAGHCINSQKECEETKWVLSQHLKGNFISKEKIIKCETLLAHKKNNISENDFALIKIQEGNNLPLSFRYSLENPFSSTQLGRSFYVLGHPNGLPLIHSGPAELFWEESDFIYRIDSDTFGGNSGSPVIDSLTGEVFGILTNGDLDYKMDHDKGCVVTHKCNGACKGENVVPLFNIQDLVPGVKPVDPIYDPRSRSL